MAAWWRVAFLQSADGAGVAMRITAFAFPGIHNYPWCKYIVKYVHLVAMLAIAQYVFFAIQVGQARGKYGVKAPATSGHDLFDRIYRVQSNTLEQLVCFLPALFVAAVYWPPLIIAAIGVVYLVGRLIYWQSYVKDPAKRGIGFMVTFIPIAVLILAAVVGAMFRTAG